MASLRQLFDSLSNEQRRNQDLLVSLAFALRSFTNLHRFLELVPVVVSRLVGVDGALIVPVSIRWSFVARSTSGGSG
jgi:sigma-B regulation protein RsbU (phosphoserine phosphatase)